MWILDPHIERESTILLLYKTILAKSGELQDSARLNSLEFLTLKECDDQHF